MDAALLAQLKEIATIQSYQNALQEGRSILVEELWHTPKALLAALGQQATKKHLLVLTSATGEENQLFNDLALFTEGIVLDFPAWETLPNERVAPSSDMVGERYEGLRQIANATSPLIVISNLQACLQKLIPPSSFNQLSLSIKIGDTHPRDELVAKLESMGYQRRPVAADKGEFAVRGGIIDLFPVSSPDPFRIEFWAEEVESIRIYDPIGQRSVRKVDRCAVTPAKELEFIEQSSQLSTLLDYLGPDTVVAFDDLLALEDRYAQLKQLSGKATRTFASIDELFDQMQSLQKLYFSDQSIEELTQVEIKKSGSKSYYSKSAGLIDLQFEMFNRSFVASRWQAPFIPVTSYFFPNAKEAGEISGDQILEGIRQISKSDLSLICYADSDLDELSFRKTLNERDIHLPLKHRFAKGYLSSGFALPDDQLIILPLTEIHQRFKLRRQKLRSTYHSMPSEFYELTPGDTVVHFHNGIGKYLGVEKRPNHEGLLSEFFLLEYADGAKLYVPLQQAHLITKYIGVNEEQPKLHTLGSSRWKKAKEQTEKAIVGYARQLLLLQAQREFFGGFAYPSDSEEMRLFEEAFPFEPTADQIDAIAKIKEDMTSPKPMDRLVCGDVGYGKTEVAMRAAFKAIVDGGKQVAMLVPTTVLAMQHFENFVERMCHFPLRIEVLSRFRTPKQIKQALEGIANGTVDLAIGTHRLLSEDVQFKNLGLIIIDEEQRFGVKAKEHLKRIKVGVDCLTLSATPIPRTLYMSLVGARDLSVINTPPHDRQPITTLIAEGNDELVRTALMRELARDGQAFFIHNRIETIEAVADKLKTLLPQARVLIGHGGMSSDELDLVFHAFKSGKCDILVATTIVENGIDIPNANTILIDRADHFGLAALYQLRGRVGRWNRRAYAYFLVKNRRSLPELSLKRLQALAESSGYGGGMKLAMRDLELRGAGDILGTEQSGHVSAIGFHLYCKLLKRTVLSMQNKTPLLAFETKIEFRVDARLPEDYVNAATLRMEIYQRLGETVELAQVDAIWEELQDRFGPPPLSAEWLYILSRIRIHALQRHVTSIKHTPPTLVIERQSQGKTATSKHLFKLPSSPKEAEKKLLEIFERL